MAARDRTCRVKFEPMKPAPPVTSTCMAAESQGFDAMASSDAREDKPPPTGAKVLRAGHRPIPKVESQAGQKGCQGKYPHPQRGRSAQDDRQEQGHRVGANHG